MSDMVESVAAAIIGHMFAPHELPITEPELLAKYRDCATAAINAMRQTSEEVYSSRRNRLRTSGNSKAKRKIKAGK